MKWFTRRKRIVPGMVLLVLITAAIFTVTAQAQSAAPAGTWAFSITPYLWMPNINGTLNYSAPPGAGGSPSVEVGPDNYLEQLEAALMISGEVRKDRWLVFTDLIYLDFSGEDSAVKSVNFGGSAVSSSANVATQSSLRGTGLDAWGGLRGPARAPRDARRIRRPALRRPGGLDGLATRGGCHRAGRRADVSASRQHLREDGSLERDHRGQGARLARQQQLVDPVLPRRRHGLVGLTWQGMLGIAYSFDWIDVKLAYRHLYFDQGSDKLIQDLRFSGPALGATFRF